MAFFIKFKQKWGYFMLFVNKLKVLTLMTCLMLVGQVFAAEDCLETATVWKDCVSAPKDTTIERVTYKKITNEKELAWLSNNIGNNAILLNDLDMGGKLWIPIAAGDGSSRKYGKIFRGNGHVIKNIYINTTELSAVDESYQQNVGFIGVLAGGKVYDLILEDVDIQASTSTGEVVANTDQEDHQISVGAIVGWMNDNSNNRVENCMVSGSIRTTGKGQGVGGIVGNAKMGTITNCMSLVEIHASGSDAYVGGIIGMSKNNITVSSCVYAGPGLTNTGENGLVGGISGNVYAGTLTATNNYFEGEGINGVGGSICSKKCTPAASIPTNENATINVNSSNVDDVASALNGANSDVWDVGETGLSLNGYGKDGYKITFDANSGKFANDKNTTNKFLQAGMTISGDEIEKPTLTGYFFAGWALTNNATEVASDLGTVSKATTIYAVWKPIYTITFNVAPGSFSADEDDDERSKSVVAGERITVEGIGSLPKKFCSDAGDHGCNKYLYFTGWTLGESTILNENELPENYDPEDYTIDLASIDADGHKTIYAVWTEVETYTVTFNANEHGKTKVDYVKVGRNETTTAPAEPEPQDGYEFGGWYKEISCENKFGFDTTKIDSNWILYAKWTPEPYTISYVMNGHSDQGDNETSYNVETATFSLIPPADVAGYDFGGWFKDVALTDEATQVTQGSTGNKTFYAKWSLKTYKISYLTDHNDTYGSASDQTKTYGTPLTLQSSGKFWRYGYEQTGWSTTKNGDKVYDLGASYTQEAADTLYPTWNALHYTITYECGGCVNSQENPDTYTIEYGDITLEDPTKAGYNFLGWFVVTQEAEEAINGVAIAAGSFGNKTFYAKWSGPIEYTATYDLDGGSMEGDESFTFTVESENIDLATPTRDGYTFVGWLDGVTSDVETVLPAGSFGNRTLTAQWTPIEFTATYDLAGGSMEGDESFTFTVESNDISLATPTKNGYSFVGWLDGVTSNVVTVLPTNSIGDRTLTAQWSLEEYTATYELAGGSMEGDESFTFTIVSGNIDLATPTRDGYTFAGWLDGVTGDVVTVLPTGSFGNRTLTAQWTPIEFTATYDLAGGSMEGDESFTFTVESNDISLATPTKNGYSFVGWLDGVTSNVVTVLPTNSIGDRTLTAQWSPVPSTITVTAISQVFEYDANPHSAECEIAADNPWGYTITATSSEQVTDVKDGEKTASCNVVIKDGDVDITTSFEGYIESVPGTISVVAKAVPYGAVTIYTDETGNRAVIDGTSSDAVSITDKDNVVVNAVTFNRTFPVNGEGENKMSTLTLPFSIEKSKVSGAEFYELNDVVGTKVRIWKSLDVLEANTPYIIRTTADHLTFTLDEGEKLTLNTEKMNNSKSSDGLWEIRGVYEYKQWTEGDEELGLAYGYTATATNNLSVGKFAKNGIGAYIKPLRAYLLKTPEKQAQKARRMLAKSIASISDDTDSDELDVEIVDRETGETTIIGKLNKATGEIKIIDNWYDMKGRRLNAKPTTKGIYYFNGKRVMVK